MGKLYFPKPLWLKTFFSNRYVYAHVVRKEDGHILASASTIEKELRDSLKDTSSTDKLACEIIGRRLASRCKDQDIESLNFEFGKRQRYHGRLKTVLDTLMHNGIQIRC
eukprot:g6231.t1